MTQNQLSKNVFQSVDIASENIQFTILNFELSLLDIVPVFQDF